MLNASALAILLELPHLGPYVVAGARPGVPQSDITKQWHRIREIAGLDGSDQKPPFRLHDFRHNFASVGVNGGMSLPVIGKLLGHLQAATTSRYAHLDADPLRRAVNTIGNAICAAMDHAAPATRTKDSLTPS